MPENDEVLRIVSQWVEKAENDLKNASHTLKLGDDCPTDTVCFHSQQCVEKYLKALLVYKSIDFPRTHSISELIAFTPDRDRPKLSPEEQERLTDYVTITRYPGDFEAIPLEEAKQAVKIARRVKYDVRKSLPTAVLRK